IYERARDRERFWKEQADQRISWLRPFDTVLEWNLPYAKWFVGGTLNACFNCVDRHVENGDGDKVAYFWEGEPEGDRLEITYAELLRRVVKAANGLRSMGIGKGTHVGVYLGMIPELPVTMLALARIGAPFTVVFGGFS